MKRFIVYSATARTSPVIKDLKGAGRIDVLLHSIIAALFASHTFREDVELHLILMGPPTSPRHIVLRYEEENSISKKDLKKLLEMALRKCKEGETRKVHPGVWVDNKSLEELVGELREGTPNIFLLDAYGNSLKTYDKENYFRNPVFILGDHDGFAKKTKKYLKKSCYRVSLGPQTYFTSQSITILHYEMDNF